MQPVDEQAQIIEDDLQSAPADKIPLWRDYVFLFSVAGFLIILDQWTKTLVRTQLAFGESWMPWEWLAPYARIVHWRNTGAAFGLFQDNNLFFSILAVVVAGVITFYFPQIERHEKLLRWALAVQMGGALGNLVDRLQFAHVTDFISVGKFPVFNVADSCITVGASILVIGVWLSERREQALLTEQAAAEAEAGDGDDAMQELRSGE